MKLRVACLIVVLVLASSTAGIGAVAGAPPPTPTDTGPAPATADGGNETSDEYRAINPPENWTDVPVRLETAPSSFATTAAGGAAGSSSIVMDPNDTDDPLVGTTKSYLGYDQGGYYFKQFTLLSLGDDVEVWVANDLSWPAGDPRADPTITEAQAESMAEQFDENMWPVESEVFGEPVPRNGSEALLSDLGIVPANYYQTGNGSSRTVLLVDNVRDQNYYDPTYPLYIAGFYSPTIQQYTDRNTITVDAYDWADVNETNQRTGYEGTLAHELQHLIHADLDGDETTWVNEGMSDYAEVITGYGVPEGHLSAYEQSPSNSLTNWEDQGAINVLADYGIAFTWTMYLEDQYGQDFISELAQNEANGIESVEQTLAARNADRDFDELYQDFSIAVVTDGLRHPSFDRFTFGNLDVQVNTSRDVGTAGAWGTNYQEIDTSDQGPITDVTVTGTDFIGTQWTTATDPVTGQGQVLYSGSGNLLDRHAIVETDLSGASKPTLTFESYQRIEENWDYGFVQVSTDGGETWHSLANANTDASPNPNAHPRVKANLPGLTGDTEGWEHQEFDLSEFAGNESVLVSFRYVTDWAFVKEGWWVKNVTVAGESVSTDSTAAFQSLREATGDYIEYQFSFIGVKHNGNYLVEELDTRTFDAASEQELKRFLRNGNFDRLIVASTWAAQPGESGRVPVGVELEFATDRGGGNGPANGNGKAKGQGKN